jgi:hypothetical protein
MNARSSCRKAVGATVENLIKKRLSWFIYSRWSLRSNQIIRRRVGQFPAESSTSVVCRLCVLDLTHWVSTVVGINRYVGLKVQKKFDRSGGRNYAAKWREELQTGVL